MTSPWMGLTTIQTAKITWMKDLVALKAPRPIDRLTVVSLSLSLSSSSRTFFFTPP